MKSLLVLVTMLVFGLTSMGSAMAADTDTAGDEINLVQKNEVQSAHWEPWDGATIAAQTLVGLTGGVVGLFLGAMSGSPAVAILTTTAGTTLGIGGTGHAMGGNGSFTMTGLGVTAGGAAGFLPGVMIIGGSGASEGGVVAGLGVFTAATLAGGIIAYHASASPTGLSVAMTPTDGGASLTLGGRF